MGGPPAPGNQVPLPVAEAGGTQARSTVNPGQPITAPSKHTTQLGLLPFLKKKKRPFLFATGLEFLQQQPKERCWEQMLQALTCLPSWSTECKHEPVPGSSPQTRRGRRGEARGWPGPQRSPTGSERGRAWEEGQGAHPNAHLLHSHQARSWATWRVTVAFR